MRNFVIQQQQQDEDNMGECSLENRLKLKVVIKKYEVSRLDEGNSGVGKKNVDIPVHTKGPDEWCRLPNTSIFLKQNLKLGIPNEGSSL